MKKHFKYVSADESGLLSIVVYLPQNYQTNN